ncbi:unnamed protein product [Closterium sp. Naga37s-1]|nr:unnamed protein product [Closterium sp. Naga37s-1]
MTTPGIPSATLCYRRRRRLTTITTSPRAAGAAPSSRQQGGVLTRGLAARLRLTASALATPPPSSRRPPPRPTQALRRAPFQPAPTRAAAPTRHPDSPASARGSSRSPPRGHPPEPQQHCRSSDQRRPQTTARGPDERAHEPPPQAGGERLHAGGAARPPPGGEPLESQSADGQQIAERERQEGIQPPPPSPLQLPPPAFESPEDHLSALLEVAGEAWEEAEAFRTGGAQHGDHLQPPQTFDTRGGHPPQAHTTPQAGDAEEAVPRRAVPPRIADLGARTMELAEKGVVDDGAVEEGAAAGGASESGREEEEEVQRLEDEAPSRVGEAAGSRTARREHLDAITSAPSHPALRERAPRRRSRPQSRLQSPQPQQEQADGRAIGGEHGGNATGRCRHHGFAGAETGDEATQGAESPDEGIRDDAETPPAGTEGAETTPGVASPVRHQARAQEMATGDATAGSAAPHEAATANAPAHGFASPPLPRTGAGRQWWTPPARSTLRPDANAPERRPASVPVRGRRATTHGRGGRGQGRRGRGEDDASATSRGGGGTTDFRRVTRRLLREAEEGGNTEIVNDENDQGDPLFTLDGEGNLEPSSEDESLEELEPRSVRHQVSNIRAGSGIPPPPSQPTFSPTDLAKRRDLFDQVSTWDLSHLSDSRQPSLARHPPKAIREAFATCLLTPLLALASNPDSEPAWRLLLFLPRLILRVPSTKRPDWPACSSRILSFNRGNWQELYEEAAKAIQLPAQPRHTTDEIGCLARAEGLAKRGNLRKSLQALQATPVAPTTPDTLAALQARHPPAELLIPDWVTSQATDTPPLIPLRDFRKIIAKCPNGVGAGPSGTTFEHLRDAALGNPDVCQHLHALTNTALAGQLSPEAASLLTVSRLVAFVKPGGGIRPIAVGECLHRLIAKCALYLTSAAARDFFTPLQLGVAVPGGTEAAIHIIRTYLEEKPTAIALQMDIANAFNAIERAAVFEGLQSTPLAPLLPFVRLTYGSASTLQVDAGFNAASPTSARGVRQGDPMGPLLFAAGIQRSLTATAAAFPNIVIIAYADDITFLGPASACTSAFNHLTADLLPIGLAHNPAKCAAWSPGPMNDADLPTGIRFNRAGLRVLGSPVGTADGCATQLREKLATASSPLPLVGRMDPQLSYLLLTRCISRRASFLARTTPLALLPTAEWSAWGERLLHTLLAAAQISEPRAQAEKERIWNQASLPTTIGGLGLTDPSTEGSYAYLASAVATAHLLRSLGSKLHQEVAELAPLLDADPTNPAALPQRLAAAEASLPPSAAAVMKAHALNLKTHTAMEADEAGIADAIEPLAEGYLFQLLEPPLGPFVDQAGGE